jgi:hypothetical protein
MNLNEVLQLLGEIEVQTKGRVKPSNEPTGILRIDDKETLRKLDKVYTEGSIMGLHCGLEQCHKLFKHVRGNLHVLFGYMNMGKSTWQMYMDMVQAVKYDHKFAWFPPENMGAERFYDELICIYTGKQSDPQFSKVRMTSQERQEAIKFISEHFYIVYPPDEEGGQILDSPHTINAIEDRFAWLIEHEGVDGVRIDPFNQLDVDEYERDDKMLSKFMKRAKRFAVKYNVFYTVSMHPKAPDSSQFIEREGTEFKDLICPDDTRIAGGAMSGNKADQITAYHRPYKKSDPKNTTIEFRCLKSKNQKLMGINGITSEIKYDIPSNRFEENRSGSYIDALQLEKDNRKARLAGQQETIIEHDGKTDHPQDVDFNNPDNLTF